MQRDRDPNSPTRRKENGEYRDPGEMGRIEKDVSLEKKLIDDGGLEAESSTLLWWSRFGRCSSKVQASLSSFLAS